MHTVFAFLAKFV